MKEFYIVSNSFAAPFFSDSDAGFVKADSAEDAIERYRETYRHPAGLYVAACYEDANAHEKGQKPLLRWVCNHELAKQRLTDGKSSYTYMGKGPGQFEIDGVLHEIEDPKGGEFVRKASK